MWAQRTQFGSGMPPRDQKRRQFNELEACSWCRKPRACLKSPSWPAASRLSSWKPGSQDLVPDLTEIFERLTAIDWRSQEPRCRHQWCPHMRRRTVMRSQKRAASTGDRMQSKDHWERVSARRAGQVQRLAGHALQPRWSSCGVWRPVHAAAARARRTPHTVWHGSEVYLLPVPQRGELRLVSIYRCGDTHRPIWCGVAIGARLRSLQSHDGGDAQSLA